MTGLHRFWEKVAQSDGCWEWTGAKHPFGHGQMWWKGRVHYAHRISWDIHYGELPDPKKVVAHHCDNPSCVNPDHLFLTDQRGNLKDMRTKNRDNKPPQEKKMDRFLAEEVRALRAAGVPRKEVAKQYNIAGSTVSRICSGKMWK